MVQNPPGDMARIVPMISYEEIPAALDWLAEAFGFQERLRYTESSGKISHAEMELDGGVIMLGTPSPDYQSPKRHREHCEDARRWSETPFVVDGLLVYVDDVDAHFERASAAGANLLSELQDQSFGDRQYRVEDLEGHRWMFAQHVRDVAAEDWGAVAS